MQKLTKYIDDESVQHIIQFKQQGKGSRWIAEYFEVSKSFVNDLYKKWLLQSAQPQRDYSKDYADVVSVRKPKILFLDIETTADIVATFGRFKVNIGESNIVQQGNQVATAVWKFKDSNEIMGGYSEFTNYEISEHSEKQLLTDLVEAISESDIVVIHNARFDLGTIQHRMLHYGMGRLPSVKVIDTLMISRKYLKLRSNKLDSITKYFGLSNKLENSGINLWIKVQQGDVEAREQMLEYNIGDVRALEDVYDKFVALNQGVNLSVYTQLAQKACTSCGSTNVHATGRQVTTGVSMFDEYECSDCGAKMRGRTNKLTKEQRQNILMPV
jgi:DNA polymerase III epsilon subunit-like protein